MSQLFGTQPHGFQAAKKKPAKKKTSWTDPKLYPGNFNAGFKTYDKVYNDRVKRAKSRGPQNTPEAKAKTRKNIDASNKKAGYTPKNDPPYNPKNDPNNAAYYLPGGAGYVDPMKEAQDTFLRELPIAMENIGVSGRSAFDSATRSQKSAAEILFNSLRTGRRDITRAREDTEMNRLNGISDVLEFVRQGMNEAGTSLSISNALDSSAAEAAARGFSQAGGRQAGQINNQAALGQRRIDDSEQDWGIQKNQGLTDLQRSEAEYINSIGTNVYGDYSQLNQQGAGIKLGNRVNSKGERDKIVGYGQKKLDGVQNWLGGQLPSLNAVGMPTIRRNAFGLTTLGNSGANFQVGQVPLGGGANMNTSPLYVGR